MSAYADSSFVVSLYVPDANSNRAASAIDAHSGTILISSAVVLESTNAFELRIYRGEGNPTECGQSAGRFSRTHSAQLGTRSLDILQVAVAMALKADTFLTFDRNQAALARAAGLLTA